MNTMRTFSLLLVLLVTGCVSPRVVTNNTAFFVDHYAPRGSISVLPAEQIHRNSLEFSSYRKSFETRLANVGYRIEDDPGAADYIALVGYGIDEGQTTTVTTPVYGYTRWGGGFHHGAFFHPYHRFGYFDARYFPPTYRVIGHATNSITVYNREISLDIVEADSFGQGDPEKVYEARTRSIGRCPALIEVFDEMLAAMFRDFPGPNGDNRKQVVSATLDCQGVDKVSQAAAQRPATPVESPAAPAQRLTIVETAFR